jgi:hypothetical protein
MDTIYKVYFSIYADKDSYKDIVIEDGKCFNTKKEAQSYVRKIRYSLNKKNIQFRSRIFPFARS